MQLLGILTGSLLQLHAASAHIQSHRFLAFEHLKSFSKEATREGVVLCSPIIKSDLPADEVIVSWNSDLPEETYLQVEARAIYPDRATKFYSLGRWAKGSVLYPRESVLNQKDSDGNVLTDTLRLNIEASRFQLRLTLAGEDFRSARIRSIGLCLTRTAGGLQPQLPPFKAAWGKALDVPERTQMIYPNGNVICSPTTLSMLLAYWGNRIPRLELDKPVPEVVQGVYDRNWEGTGNWTFNMSYAGSFPGMRAYVTRMADVSELEQWVASGIPVGLSLCYDRLRGKASRNNGHLVVCVGFTRAGDVILNDPGTTLHVRKVFSRANLVSAWAYSRNTAYVIYPEGTPLPRDRFGHWASRKSAPELLRREK